MIKLLCPVPNCSDPHCRRDHRALCVDCDQWIDEAELVKTSYGPMHESCAQDCETAGLFKYDPGDSVWPR
jgi:hypothetical protein